MSKHSFVILGAGPTGLGAAYRLKELGINDFLILEASDHAGGLASTITDKNGFLWDLGGHVHFSHYNYYDEALKKVLGDDFFFEHQRNSQIWMDDRFVPYPFQNNIHHLRGRMQAEILWELFKAKLKPKKTPADFSEWIYSRFGSGIANHFLIPYNTKVWATPPTEMDVQWMGDRVADVKFGSILWNTLTKKNQTAWGPNNMFRFPKKGGSGAIWTAMAAFIGPRQIRTKTEVKRVDSEKKIVSSENESFEYETLLSTLPMDNFIALTEGLTQKVRQAAHNLLFSSTHVVGIGMEGKPPPSIFSVGWMYFPEPEIPFYRATVFSNYSPMVVPYPEKQWSLLLEISESKRRPLNGDPIKNCLDALLKLKFITSKNEVVSEWHTKIKHGYPTPHLGRDLILHDVHDELENKQIFSRGRFGGWKYEASNQDHSFMQGVELINRLIKNEVEQTYPHPEVINGGSKK